MDINSVVAIVSIIAGLITILWFIRDVWKHNGLILKSIEEGQRKGFETLIEGQRKGFEILAERFEVLAEGQRKGFETLIEGQRKGFETLAQILFNTTQILAKIEENTRR